MWGRLRKAIYNGMALGVAVMIVACVGAYLIADGKWWIGIPLFVLLVSEVIRVRLHVKHRGVFTYGKLAEPLRDLVN